jgi:hypothetical protein
MCVRHLEYSPCSPGIARYSRAFASGAYQVAKQKGRLQRIGAGERTPDPSRSQAAYLPIAVSMAVRIASGGWYWPYWLRATKL